MIKLFNRFMFAVIGLACLLAVLWLIANQQQKQQLNQWYQRLAEPLQQSGLDLPDSLLPEQPQPEQKQAGKPAPAEAVRPRVCRRVKSEDIDPLYRVYEWRDANGQLQVSDKPPASEYSALHVKELFVENFFALDVDNSQASLPGFTQDHIRAGVSKTYRTFSEVIKVAQIRKIQLKLKFISDEAQFHAYRKQVAPDTNYKATGFYNSRLNQSTIWAVGDKHHLTRISLHEATHAMVAAMFGDMPIWLNEGLAGFFEKMVITGEQTYKFATNDEHLKLLRSSRLPSLRSHFAQTHDEWNHPATSDLNYAIDWSLVFYLMTRSDGRQLLRYMLDQMAVNYCHAFDATTFIDQHYPGGVARLESNWRQWLKITPSGTVTF